jgi:hypothetical protein
VTSPSVRGNVDGGWLPGTRGVEPGRETRERVVDRRFPTVLVLGPVGLEVRRRGDDLEAPDQCVAVVAVVGGASEDRAGPRVRSTA